MIGKEERIRSYHSIKYLREAIGADVNYGCDKYGDRNYVYTFDNKAYIIMDEDIPSKDGHYVIIKSDRMNEPDEAVYYQVFNGKPVDYHILSDKELEEVIYLELRYLVEMFKEMDTELSEEIKNKY